MQIKIKKYGELEAYPTCYIHGRPQEAPIYEGGRVIGKMKIVSPTKAEIETYEGRFEGYEILIECKDPGSPAFKLNWVGRD